MTGATRMSPIDTKSRFLQGTKEARECKSIQAKNNPQCLNRAKGLLRSCWCAFSTFHFFGRT